MENDQTTLNWYAVHTRSRFEKCVAAQLAQGGITHFLPLLPRVRRWKDREKTVCFPLFPGYIFVRLALTDRLDILRMRGVVRLLGVDGRPTPIPEEEIDGIRRLLMDPGRLESEAYVEVGDWVEVTEGVLAGVRGRLLERRGRRRLVVGVRLIRQAVSVEIDVGAVRQVPTGMGRVESAA